MPELEAGPDEVLNAEHVATKLEWPVVWNCCRLSLVDITGSERQRSVRTKRFTGCDGATATKPGASKVVSGAPLTAYRVGKKV